MTAWCELRAGSSSSVCIDHSALGIWWGAGGECVVRYVSPGPFGGGARTGLAGLGIEEFHKEMRAGRFFMLGGSPEQQCRACSSTADCTAEACEEQTRVDVWKKRQEAPFSKSSPQQQASDPAGREKRFEGRTAISGGLAARTQLSVVPRRSRRRVSWGQRRRASHRGRKSSPDVQTGHLWPREPTWEAFLLGLDCAPTPEVVC